MKSKVRALTEKSSFCNKINRSELLILLEKIKDVFILKHTNLLLLLGILLIGAFLRLYQISDYLTFLGDEGRDVLIVKQMIVDHKFTLLGPTASVGGFFLGPIYYYFMLPFLWLWKLDPTGPAVMVALFGIATIFLVYLVGKEFFGEKTGIFASTLYAVSPLVLTYSRSSWNPNLMPFFSLLTLFVLYRGIIKQSTTILFIDGIILGVTFQLHYLATFLAVIVVVYLILMEFKKAIFLIEYCVFLVIGFIVGLSPFLFFEIRHGFLNTQTVIRFVFGSTGDIGFTADKSFNIVTDLSFRLFWRLLTHFPPLYQITISQSPILTVWYWGITLLMLTSIGFFLFLTWRSLKEKSRAEFKKLSLLFLWLFLGVGLFAFYKKPIYDYYLGFMYPLPFLLVGNLLAKAKGFLKILSGFIFTILFINSLQGSPFRHPPNRQLSNVKEIANFVLEKTEGKPYNFALITGQNSDHAYRYFLEVWGAEPVVIENPQLDPERKTVTEQLLVVCEVIECKPLGHPLWEIAGFGSAEIVGEWEVSTVRVLKLIRYRR